MGTRGRISKQSLKMTLILANRANHDKMPLSATFHLGLHCLPKYPLSGFQHDNSKNQINLHTNTSSKSRTVTCLTADPGIASSILATSHTFVEIGHEIITTAILPLPLIQEGLLSATSESMCNCLVKLAQEKSLVTVELTVLK